MAENEKKLYQQFLRLGIGRECALNLILLKRGVKDAATIGHARGVAPLLKKNGYTYLLDVSYVTRSIHGFLEETTKTPIPGAGINRRFYAGHGINKEKLKYLASAPDFGQGLLFGFPFCCTLNFCRKAAYEKKRFIDVLKDWVGSLPGRGAVKEADFRLIGGVLKYLQPIRLIQHIPCRPACPESVALAQRNLDLLGELDPGFRDFSVSEFHSTVLLYGNTWEDIGILQVEGLKTSGPYRYSGRCRASVSSQVPAGASLNITLHPHRSVVIESGGKQLARLSSSRALPWSYCFVSPVDTLAKT